MAEEGSRETEEEGGGGQQATRQRRIEGRVGTLSSSRVGGGSRLMGREFTGGRVMELRAWWCLGEVVSIPSRWWFRVERFQLRWEGVRKRRRWNILYPLSKVQWTGLPGLSLSVGTVRGWGTTECHCQPLKGLPYMYQCA